MVKYIITGIIIIILLMLDWAALHDIVKGTQPGYWAEYAMLTVSAIVFAAIAFFGFRKIIKKF